MCPFKKSSCGFNNQLNFYNTNEDGAIHIKELKKGDACVYNVESVCGAPSFSVYNKTGVEVVFAEWQQDRVQTSRPYSGRAPKSIEMKESSPLTGMPVRDTDFSENAGTYNYESDWKSWGNTVQGAEAISRRQRDGDNDCTLRNMLISVVSINHDSQLLIEFKNSQLNALSL